MKMRGDKELIRALKKLPDKIARKVARKSVNAGATEIVKAARTNAKVQKDSGLLAKSMGKKSKTYKAAGVIVSIIGPRRNVEGTHNGKRRVPFFYAHLVESGHIDARTGRFIPGSAFMTRAAESSKGAAIAKVTSKARTEINAEAAKLKQKTR